MEFIHARNAEIMRAYRAACRRARHIYLEDLMEEVASTPTSRFWVSEERAAYVVRLMEEGRSLPQMRETKREMYEEIYRRYMAEREREPGLSRQELIARVIYQPAPKFYLTARTIGEFIYKIKSGRWYGKRSKEQ